MMKRRGLKKHLSVLKSILWLTIFRYRDSTIAAVLCFGMVFASTYFLLEATIHISSILESSYKGTIQEGEISRFVTVSVLGTLLRYIPKMVYTYIIQEVCRRKLVYYLKEYMSQHYDSFHKRMPGEMRYSIFLRAYASVMCSQLFVFEVPIVTGTTFFSIFSTKRKMDPGVCALILLTPLLYLTCVFFYVLKLFDYQDLFLQEQERVSGQLYDKLINYEIIKAFSIEAEKSNELDISLSHQEDAQVSMGRFQAIYNALLSFILLFPYITIAFLFIKSYVNIKPSVFFAITLTFTKQSDQLKRLGNDFRKLMLYLNQIKFSEIEDVQEAEESRIEEVRFEESIVFKDVVLLYENTPIVSGINIEIRKGEKIAIVGPNGSGKSTFLKTILGFTRFEGDILIDGRSVRDLNWRSIRRLISYIPQNDYTSDDTVMNNLLLGNPTVTREYIEDKARAFGAHDTFMQLENGYDTHVGPRGNRLSGGQKQKLSLVRAGVRDGAIFVMDEATASMDKKYEKEVFDALFANLKDKTLLMIVHGGEYLKRFDRLIVLNEGQVEDFGTYDKLLRRSKTLRMLLTQVD